MAQSIAQTLESFLNTDATQITTSFVERHKVAKLLHALIQKFESPMDTILRLIWQQPTMMAALKVCHDLGIFQTLATASGFMSLEDLVRSTKSNIRPELLHRLLRHLAAMGALREQDPVSYASTPFSDALTKKEVVGGLSCWFDIFGPVFLAMPEYLATHDYQGNNPKHGIWQTIKGTDLPLFPYLSLNPQMMNNFANNMAGYASDRGRWTDIYPVSERLLQDVEEDEVVIVDVGGGLGQDMKNFLRLHPKTGAKLVVQDLPEVIEEAQRRSKEDITFLAHDFFTPQPLKGARAYYLHSILHDWQDDKAIDILKNLAPAFKPGHSRLLINEGVIPDVAAHPMLSGIDLVVMGVLASGERRRIDWERLLDAAGFHITGIWTNTGKAYDSIIEAELIA